MNEKAEALGMAGSHFANATSIDAASHYMTTRNVARPAQALVREHPEILDFTSAPSLEIGGRTFKNIHRLVGRDPRTEKPRQTPLLFLLPVPISCSAGITLFLFSWRGQC